MSTHDPDELGGRLVALAPPIDLPVDLIDGVRRRARRRRAARVSSATAGVAAVVAGALLAVHVISGPAGPSDSQLRELLAAGSATPVPYTGVGSDAVKNTTFWLIGDYYSPPKHMVIVSYTRDGHPCLGAIEWGTAVKVPRSLYGFDGSCAVGDAIDSLGIYGPVGPASMVGRVAYLFGTVPSDVRVVGADVNSGPRIAEHFVATTATPTTTKERFVVFTVPTGTDRELDVDLTFYDVNGDRIGSRHIHHRAVTGQ